MQQQSNNDGLEQVLETHTEIPFAFAENETHQPKSDAQFQESLRSKSSVETADISSPNYSGDVTDLNDAGEDEGESDDIEGEGPEGEDLEEDDFDIDEQTPEEEEGGSLDDLDKDENDNADENGTRNETGDNETDDENNTYIGDDPNKMGEVPRMSV